MSNLDKKREIDEGAADWGRTFTQQYVVVDLIITGAEHWERYWIFTWELPGKSVRLNF